jgi:DNA invertase Pin-like site-specific DNA recombinase
VTQELGILVLIRRGVRVVTASGDDLTETDDPFKVAMRQIAGAFAQLEKARLVAKLKAARDRKRATGVKVEGRHNYAELNPELVATAKRLRRKERMSFRAIAAELARRGYVTRTGRPYSASAVMRMVERR